MYLSRYVVSKKSIILEIDPSDGSILKRFKQPKNWQWNPDREMGHWEEYDGIVFLVYRYKGNLVFQSGCQRFVLGEEYSSRITRQGKKWMVFQLFWGQECVYDFTYQDPQTRKASLLRALVFDDDWWDWDTPFEDAHKYLQQYT